MRGVFVSVLGLVFFAASAQGHVDVLFYDVGGQIVTGATDFGPPLELIAGVRVFPVLLDGGDVTNSPGFTAYEVPPDGVALPDAEPIPFSAEAIPLLDGRTFSYWNGEGEVAFGAPPGGARLEIDPSGCFSCTSAFVEAYAADVPDFPLGTTDALGELHKHHDFKLRPGSGDLPPPGLYLVALRASMESVVPSEPFFLLFSKNFVGAPVDAASEWIETVVLPEPGGLAQTLAAFAAIALSARASRRRAS